MAKQYGIINLTNDIKTLKQDVNSYVREGILTALAFGTENAMRKRLRDTDAISTGNLMRSIITIPQGDNLVITVSDKASAYAGFVDTGIDGHIVRVDNRKSLFKSWAVSHGLNNSVGPFFSYGPKGRFNVTINHPGKIYLGVGFDNSKIHTPGVGFSNAGIKYIDNNVDKVVTEHIDTVLKKMRV